jgi:hypothetical protein
VTIVHEAGHAGVAVLAGRRLAGIRVHADTSGLTTSWGPSRGAGLVFTLLAGYPAPALLGVGAAWMVTRGYAVAALWVLLVVLALVLVRIRNGYGLLVVLLSAGVVLAVTGWTSAEVCQSAACLVMWLFLLGAPRAVLELAAGASRGSDAAQLARKTGVHRAVWIALFLVFTVGALAWGTCLVAGHEAAAPQIALDRRLTL